MNKKLAIGAQVALGFLLGATLNAGIIWLGSPAMHVILSGDRSFVVWLYALILIGVVQLIWQVPAILLLRWRGQKMLALGVILAVSVTALLNATCWGLFLAGKIKIGG